MNLREAILKAADHIEANPGLFDFGIPMVPNNCWARGCALGWIGYFADVQGESISKVSTQLLGLRDSGVFYGRMNEWGADWDDTATEAARALRLYADKYHPKQGWIATTLAWIFRNRRALT